MASLLLTELSKNYLFQTFDETIFEEVIKCYRMLSILVMKNADTIKVNSKKINNIINQRNKLLRRMLSAG